MKDVYLGLGSNLGDRKNYLGEALSLLDNNEAIKLKDVSSFYETDPVGYLEQDSFLNCVALIETKLPPNELLIQINKVEKDLERSREIRWGPRTIDIDILIYENLHLNEKDLIIPHKEMWNRAFVLVPLKEVYKNNLKYNRILDEKFDSVEGKETVKYLFGKEEVFKEI